MGARRFREPRLILLFVLILAAGLRGGYLVERRSQPDFTRPEIDAAFHDDWARSIVYGAERAAEWRRADRSDPLAGEPYLRPPGYPWFLALVYALSGGSYLAAVLANQLLGLLTAYLLYRLLRRTAGAWAGVLAAAVAGLHWGTIFFEGELQATALLGALEAGALLALLTAAAGRTRASFGAGLLLGACALTRPNALVFLPLALVWLAHTRRVRALPWRAPLLALLAGTVLAISPATLRNLHVSGHFVPISANLGINLYLGNNPDANGLVSNQVEELGSFRTCYDYPALVARLEERLDRPLDLPAVSRYFTGEALKWIGGHPGEFLALSLRKARFLIGATEVGHNKEVAIERAHSPLLRWLPFPFPLLLALAVAGALVGLHRGGGEDDDSPGGMRRDLVRLAGGFALLFALSLLPFFAAARYRVPLVPLLASLIGLLAGRRVRALYSWRGVLALGVLILASFASPPLPGSEAGGSAKYELLRAQGFFAQGRYDEARAAYERALAKLPNDPGAHYGLAVLEQKLGHDQAARGEYRAVLASEPNHPKANFNLGFLLLAEGDREGALAAWRRAEGADPLLAAASYQIGKLLLSMGRGKEARAALERAVERSSGEEGTTYRVDLALLLATSRDAGLRDGARALSLAEEALELADDPGVRFVHAAALAELGRFDEAASELEALLPGIPPGGRGAFEAALAQFRNGRPLRR